MPHDPAETAEKPQASAESRLTLLVLEARGLHLLSQKFATHCLMLGLLPRCDTFTAQGVREISRDLSASWGALRNAGSHMLKDADPALIKIMRGAFTREVEQTFECFQGMAQSICAIDLRNKKPDPADLGEMVRFVNTELHTVFNSILSAALLVAELGSQNVAQQALTDELTGLPNRRALHDLLTRLEIDGWPTGQVAVMHIDLDKFKSINDTLGHAAGDAALGHATAAMNTHVRPEDFIARVGGDEFVIIYFGEIPEETLASRADSLIEDISAPFVYHGNECRIGGSVGISVGRSDDGTGLDRHLNNADLALYTAKNAGRGVHKFFTPNLRSRYEELEELQTQIREGLANGEFEPYFQPQVEGRSGKLIGLESLARWHHPTRGLLAPFHFLDVAEQADLLDQLDEHLMEVTFSALADWLREGLPVGQVSINLNSSRLRKVDLVDNLLLVADKFELDPSGLGVEILESAMIEDTSDRMIQNIRRLSEAGFKVELDDFGTGHASISNLRNFKVDRIKIDKSFVKDVHLHSELAKITSAMIGLAHSLRVDALAEGVETAEERLVLNALGCDHIQGFGVARPLPRSEVSDWIRKTQQVRRLPPRRTGKKSTGPQRAAG